MSLSSGLTIEDYEKLPDALALNHELVEGELVDVSGNTPEHNLLRDFIVSLLRAAVAGRRLGRVIAEQEFDFGGNAHGPDITFIGADSVHLLNPKLRVQRFVPDLAIEIVSRNDNAQFLTKKVTRYRQCGSKEVWIFDIENRVAFHFSQSRRVILDENEIFAPETIPGFSIRIGDLFDQA
jgi:Uma2 family endonuclease